MPTRTCLEQGVRVRDVAAPTYERQEDIIASPALPETQPDHALDLALVRRLARAKTRLDRMERDLVSRDLSALMAARVEFMLASRALADHLIAMDFHRDTANDYSGALSA